MLQKEQILSLSTNIVISQYNCFAYIWVDFPHLLIEVSQKTEKYKYCQVFNEKSDQLETIKFFKIWSDYCAENDSFSEKSTLQWYFGFKWNTTVNHGLSWHEY